MAAASVMETDIDRFIRDQKSKLASERQTLSVDDSRSKVDNTNRKTWDRTGLSDHKLAEQKNERPSTPDQQGLPLGNNKYEERKRQLAAERYKEYNQLLSKNASKVPTKSKDTVPPDSREMGLHLDPSVAEEKKKQLEEERRQEYNDMLSKKQPNGFHVPTIEKNPSEAQSLPPGAKASSYDYASVRRQLQEEKKKEYNALLAKQAHPMSLIRKKSAEIDNPTIIPYDHESINARKQQKMREERQREYNEMMAKKQLNQKKREVTPEGMGLPIGQYEKSLQEHRVEKQKAYREMLAQQQEERDRLMMQQLGMPEVYAKQPKYDADRSRELAYNPYDYSYKEHKHRLQEPSRRDSPPNYTTKPPRPQPIEIKPHKPTVEELLERLAQGRREMLQLTAELPNEEDNKIEQRPRDVIKHEPQVERDQKAEPGVPSVGQKVETNEEQHQRLNQDQRQEYNSLTAQAHHTPQRRWVEDDEEKGLPLGRYEERHRQFDQERQKEYQDLLDKSQPQHRKGWRETSAEKGLPLGQYGEQSRKFQEEKRRDYNEALLNQNPPHDRQRQQGDLPPKPPTPGGFLNKLGSHRNRQEELREERRQEYNNLLAEKNVRTHGTGGGNAVEYTTGLPGMRNSNSAKLQKMKQRNEEYNAFLREKEKANEEREKRIRGGDGKHGYHGQAPDDIITDQVSPRRSRPEEAPPDAPRRGWATPTYEEMLQQKRQEEARYRRYDDPEYTRPGMQSYNSEGALNRLEAEKHLQELDKEYETKKNRFRNEQARESILDDPTWLSPRLADPDTEYSALLSRLEDFNRTLKEDVDSHYVNTGLQTKPVQTSPERYQPPPDLLRAEPAGRKPNEPGYFATLPVGRDERVSAQQRKKEQYKKELQKQMQEAEEGRRREKAQDLRVNATGENDPMKRSEKNLGRPPVAPTKQYQSPEVIKVYQTPQIIDAIEKISPRSEAVLGRRPRLHVDDSQYQQIKQLDMPITMPGSILDKSRHYPSTGIESSGGILERGFESLLQPPKIGTIRPPPGLEYQPSSYITGGGGGYNSLDEAYHYFATKNPLDAGSVAPEPRVPPLALSQAGAPPPMAVSPTPRVRFDNRVPVEQGGGRGGGGGGGGGMVLTTDQEKKNRYKQSAQSYQAELAMQIEEAKMKKVMEKVEQERYERKIEEEARDYHPYGRGGGGAPNRDQRGHVVADLRKMHKSIVTGTDPVRRTSNWQPFELGLTSPRPPSPRDDKIRTPPKQTTAHGDTTYARGGHGIFGMPKTDEEKNASLQYKDDLQRQIEEKKIKEMLDKEKERMEEEREMRRLEEQRLKMQREYEEERIKIREKEEAARRKNDELIQLALERKQDAERRKREEDDRRQEALRDEAERERLERQALDRVGSPLIESSVQPRAVSRAHSADVLKHLDHLRQQLQTERNRVESMLEKNDNEPEVYDPRLTQRPPPAPRSNIDVFEMARNRNTVPVRRAGTADHANPAALQDFNYLKHTNSDSRHEFQRNFPSNPVTNDALETQQAALLRQQEDKLRAMKDRSIYEKALPNMQPKDLGLTRHGTLSPQPMLQSNSAFIDLEGMGQTFPEDLEDLPHRNESARERRRGRYPSSPRPSSLNHDNHDPMGSVASLDVDKIAKRNEKRLKNLKDLQGDDVSLLDPEDVIDRFMSKQAHNRPPSSHTMQDDSWLRAGSKGSRY